MTMMKHKFLFVFISAFILTNFFSPFSPASAQSVLTLGEIHATGTVFIESSYGNWQPSAKTYPLLQGTKIKTGEGSASLHFRDGSRVDLSKNTMAVIEGSSSDVSVKLVSGVIAFNISPASSLTVSTASTDVSVNSRKGIVQKVFLESAGWSLGAVSVSDKGTEVKSISGKIFVSVSSSDMKLVAPGENIFIGSDGKYNVYKTQAIRSDHRIKNGDLLEVKTEGFEGIYKVDSKGTISLPANKNFHVAGLTTAEAEKMIADSLGKSLEKTIVTIVEQKKIIPLVEQNKSAGLLAKSSGENIAAIAIGTSQAITVGALSGFVVFRGNRHASPSIP